MSNYLTDAAPVILTYRDGSRLIYGPTPPVSEIHFRYHKKVDPQPVRILVAAVGIRTLTGNAVALSSSAWASIDGRTGAPAGTAQYPHVFDTNPATQTWGETYLGRPPWQIAGVDYAVGIDRSVYPTDANLKDPLPGGVMAAALTALGCDTNDGFNGISNSTSTIFIHNSNITIDGWDFSLHGGRSLHAAGNSFAHDVTISNNKFVTGANNQGVSLFGTGNDCSNFTVIKNVFDQNAANFPTGGTAGSIDPQCYGNNVLQYNSIRNAWAENIVLGSSRTGQLPNWDIRFNVIGNAGYGFHLTGGTIHGDWVQVQTGGEAFNNLRWEFNTWIQDQTVAQGYQNQGMTYAPMSQLVNTVNFNYNSIACINGSDVHPQFGVSTPNQLSTTITNNYSANRNDNGIWNLYQSGGSGTVTAHNNFNLLTGVMQDP